MDHPYSGNHRTDTKRPEFNRETRQQHRKEVFWQITFPLCAAGLLAVAGVVYLGFAPPASASLGADISLIFILIITGILVLPVLIVIAALAFGVWKMNAVLPTYAYLVQRVFSLAAIRVRGLADKAVTPVLEAESRMASLRAVVPMIRARITRRP